MIAYTIYEIDYRVRRYAEALVEWGHRVDVIALRRKGEKRHGLLKEVKIDRIQEREFNEKGLHSYIFRNLLFFIKASLTVLIKHLKYRYKIIHIHNAPDFLVFTGFIPKLLGAKIILDMHENMPELYAAKFNKGLNTQLVKILLFIEKISTRLADHVIAAHDLLRERIIARDGIPLESCTALLNYPSLRFFQASSSKQKKDRFKIIYPGTISYHHGLDIAIKALAIVKKEIPAVKLDIYTRSSNAKYYTSLISLIVDLDLRDNVEIFEPVMSEELGKILTTASLGIVPKRAGLFASEAFSSKILDYMVAGVPIVASRTKIDEYYFDGSMIMFFEPEDHHDLARCILELYRNPAKRESLVHSAKQLIAVNNWEVKKEIYYRIVEQLAAEFS